jgi:DNA polymerase IV
MGLCIAATRPRNIPSSPDSQQTPKGQIKVIKLEWLDECLKNSKLMPVEPYLVYHAQIAYPPQKTQTLEVVSSVSSQTSTSNAGHVSDPMRILQRARQDAGSQLPASHFQARQQHPKRGVHSQTQPPKLYRQTTSEHDRTIPLSPTPDWVKNNVLYACMRSTPLHPPNEEFMNQLLKIRKIRELTLNEIGVRAYSTSIASIAAYPYEFRSPEEILSLPGCDTKIAALFAEFKESPDGILAVAEALETDPILKVLHRFYNIWGVGPKTARDFYYQRVWRSLDDVIDHGWDSLSRVQQIGLKYYDEFLAGISRSEVERIAKIIHQHANLVRPGCDFDGRGVEYVIVGGYRRGKEICGDIDLVLTHRDESVTKDLVVDIVGSLESEGWITHTLALHLTTSNRDQQTLPFRGEHSGQHHFDSLDKAMVVWQDPHFEVDPEGSEGAVAEQQQDPEELQERRRRQNPNPHRRVDIIVSPWRTVGCAVLGWSGGTTFERDLRRWAKKAHSWKFDSSGVRERTTGGKVIDLEQGGATWEEREKLVMEGLGVGWRSASERCTR